MWCENGKQISLASSTHIVTAHDPTPFGSRHMACACRCHLSLRDAILQKNHCCQRYVFGRKTLSENCKTRWAGKAGCIAHLLPAPHPTRQERQRRTHRRGLQARDDARGNHERSADDALRVEPLAEEQQPKGARPERLGGDDDGRGRLRHLRQRQGPRLARCAVRRGGRWVGGKTGDGGGVAAVWRGKREGTPPASALSSRRPARGRW